MSSYRYKSRRGLVSQAVTLVAEQLVYLFYPSVLTSSILFALRRHGALPGVSNLPTWAIIFSGIISIPVFHIGKAKLSEISLARKAKRLGAKLPPRWEGKSIGNIDLLVRLADAGLNGFLSEPMWQKMQETPSGSFELYILWDRNLITSDANIVKAVLATEFSDFVKGEKFNYYMQSVLGTGVFNSDGDMWKFHRSMTRPFFSRDRISHFELFDRHADHAIKKLKSRFNDGFAVDFQDLIARFTLDSATDFLFGQCVDSLSTTLPYPWNVDPALRTRVKSAAEDFAQAFAQAQDVIAHRVRVGNVWPWYELFNDKTVEPMRIVDAYLVPILERALEKARLEKEDGLAKEIKQGEVGDDDTLLDHLVRFTQDPTVLHDEVLNIMIAGRDTESHLLTAAMLTMGVYFLSQHPDVLKRLREEILEKVGSTRRPDYDDIRDLKYLRAVINETMRLYPAVPWNLRYPTKDVLLPSDDPSTPYFHPAGTPVSYSVHCMHRRKDYWGPDADNFDPDRFIDERLHKYLTPNPFIFLPFNAGPRICLGQQFAYNEMSFFLIRLLQNFDTIHLDTDSLAPDSRPRPEWAGAPGRMGIEKFWAKSHLTLYAKGGMWVKMGEAKQQDGFAA